jgi:hypothetical protein
VLEDTPREGKGQALCAGHPCVATACVQMEEFAAGVTDVRVSGKNKLNITSPRIQNPKCSKI